MMELTNIEKTMLCEMLREKRNEFDSAREVLANAGWSMSEQWYIDHIELLDNVIDYLTERSKV